METSIGRLTASTSVLQRPMPSAAPGVRARPKGRRLSPWLRKAVLAAHVIISVGWLGLVVALLALAITAATTGDPAIRRAGYVLMDVLGTLVTPPALAPVGVLVTGFILSLGTEWGLFRQWWIVAKLALTMATIASGGGFVDRWLQQAIAATSQPATGLLADPNTTAAPTLLIYGAVAHLLMLGAATAISIFKPWGRVRARSGR